MLYLGIFLVLYGIVVFWVTLAKPEKIWNMGKIQAFVKILGKTGTEIFFVIFGAAALGIGIWLLTEHWPAA
ncbi:MAG: hypothetical protein U5N26_03070 [Candidatus Marinimicrobia bacterium]|nr:hypothetical protein [Candidatus Neomarinimicrobiota bacterium]